MKYFIISEDKLKTFIQIEKNYNAKKGFEDADFAVDTSATEEDLKQFVEIRCDYITSGNPIDIINEAYNITGKARIDQNGYIPFPDPWSKK